MARRINDTHSLVHEFTSTHKTSIENDDGTFTYVDNQSHLEQLEHAITGNRGTGGSGSLTKSPISLKAVAIKQDITKITTQHWPNYGKPQHANTPLAAKIRQWAAYALNSNDKAHEETLNAYLHHWVHQIQQLFEPSVELAAPCPECNESFIWRHDGVENVKKRTLTYNQHRATCINCGQNWEGKTSMVNLARIINHNQPLNGNPAHTTETKR